MDRSLIAQLAAVVVLAIVTAVMARHRRQVWVATKPGTVPIPNSPETERRVNVGDIVAETDVKQQGQKDGVVARPVRFTLLRSLVVGADNRLSTSKTVAFAWTYVIAYALLALVFADWFGDHAGFRALTDQGLQEEYLIALGGPYAAAVLAKYSAVSAAQNEGKPATAPGDAKPEQLVANDAGDGDLGDFQYVLFNGVAIAWVLVTIVFHLQAGLPEMPAVLAALALTSAGAYSAKKLLRQVPPSLSNLLPPEVPAGKTVEVWGNNLILPAPGPQDPEQRPTVMMGSEVATISTTASSPGGVDHLWVEVPETLAPGSYTLTAVRADGVPARGPQGSGGLPLRVVAGAQTTTSEATDDGA